MNKNKKWYSLFLVMLISLATVIQPIQAVAAVTALDTVAEETQAKSMETPNVDNIDETNKVVEEEPATSVSEETKTTDTIEETISSEITEETTASEEKTVESSTEETKESKENPKAKALRAEREPRNIKEALGDTNFLTKVNISVIDSEGKELDYKNQPVPATAKLALDYHFALPNDLLSKKEILAGDYYDIDLPSSIQIAAGKSMELKQGGVVFGTAVVTAEGKIRVTFNEKVEELFNIVGEISYSREFKDTITAGENIIPIPINGGEETIKVDILPNGGTPISKSGALGTDKKSVTWEVDINTNLNKLVDATVTDPMPEGLKLTELKVYEQKINLNGEIIPGSQTLLSKGNGYEHLGDIVTFPGENTKSYKLVYETVVKEDFIPEEGGDRNFHNKAVLTNQGKTSPAESSVGAHYGELIKKTGPSKNEKVPGHQYTWTIAYNHGFKDLPKDSKITDTLGGSNQEYVKGKEAVKAWVDGGRWLEEGKDFVVTYNGKNEMEIVFPNGLKEAIYIQYDTKVPFVVDDTTTGESATLTNTATTGGKFSSVGKGTIATNGMTKSSKIDYEKRFIEWEIEVNKYNNEMFNWSLTDKMTAGLVFDPTSVVIKEVGGPSLKQGTDFIVNFTEGTSNFEIKFLGDRAIKTSSAYKITYKTAFDRSKDKYNNTATSHWEDSNGKTYTQTVERDQTVKPIYKDSNNGKKSGLYNATTKKITWITMVNYNQAPLKNASITDKITEPENQKYVEGSARLLEVKIPTGGDFDEKYILDTGVLVRGAATVTNNIVTANLPNESKAYALVFETSLENIVIDGHEYKNLALYNDGTSSKELKAGVTPANGGKYASKSGKQDNNNVNWTVTINPSQSTMKNVVVVDKPSTNQVLDNNSIVIYKTKVASNGYISKTNEKLALGEDYKVDIQTNNETGEQVLTVSLLKEINTSYILEYRSLISSTQKYNDTLSNTISINADNDQVDKWETHSQVPVEIFGGSASGSAAALKIVKVDKNDKTKKPLQGAKFELWSTVGGKKGQMVRSGETDENGELKFGNLLGGVEYLLFETKAPEGYSVSKQLRDGYRLKTKEDGKINVYEEIIMENDIPRIQLKKVDAETKKAVAKAEFVIKNADGKFYNGIDDKNKSQWVASEKEAKKIVSNEKGIVEVVGLEPGVYSAKEIKAPEGYDKLTQDVAFEVVDDLGWIRLKNPVTIENKAYETTFITINKTWDDANNQDDKRPDEISFDLLAGKEVVKIVTLSKADKDTVKTTVDGKDIWTKTFDGLRKFDADMKEITYSVKEHEVSGYVTPKEVLEVKDRGVAVTNTYTPETVSLIANKIWDDENNQDGKRPGYIVVHVMAKVEGEDTATSVKHIRVDEASGWKYEFKDLPKFKAGKEITYTVEEETVDGYDVVVTNMKSEDKPKEFDYGFDITNKHEVAKRDISVKKEWNDANNQDGKRVDSVEVQLLADGKEVGKPKPLNSTNGWSATWKELDKNKSVEESGRYTSKEIVYTVEEVTKVEGYEDALVTGDMATGYTVVNTHKPEEANVSGTKTWEDNNNQDGIRPTEITVSLLADGQPVLNKDNKEVTQEVKADEKGKWNYTFTNLPKYKDGKEIVYSVKEAEVKGYTSKVEGMNLTNTHKPKETKVSGTKTWEDNNNQDGIRPTEITVSLLADGQPVLNKDNKEVTQEVKADKEGNWSYTFENLPKFKAGTEIVYSVKEAEVKGYTSKADGMNLTNTHKPSIIPVMGEKVWDDNFNQDGIRPTMVKINLLANGKVVDSQELTGDQNAPVWRYMFANLPEFEDGEKIDYTVTEDSVLGYTGAIKGTEITNSYTPGKRDVTVQKIWNDADNQDGIRPGVIEVQLYADEKELGEAVELTEENAWNHTWSELPVKQAGKAVKYEVKEVEAKELEAYTTKTEEKSEGNFVITNSYTPKETEISVNKVWEDVDNQDGIRPESIKVQLYADEKELGEAVELTEEKSWNHTWEKLALNKAGKAIKYSVKEVKAKNLEAYTSTVKEKEAGKFTITNTYKPQETRLFVEKVWDDADNQDGKRPKSIDVQLLTNGAKGKVYTLSKENNWKISFDKLAVFAKGKKIDYTVEEISAAAKEVGYKAKIAYGTNKENKQNTDVTVTNSREIEKVSVSGTKTFEDAENQDGIRPTSVTVKLLADGKEIKEQKIDDKTKWTYSFTGLPKYKVDEEGQEIKYTVEEESAGYKAEITKTETGFDIVNVHTPGLTKVSGTKHWDDADNQDGIRPKAITVNLFADGAKIQSEEVTAEDNWSYEFTKLPVYKVGEVGKEVIYSIEEEAVEGYTFEASKDNFDITNTHVPELTTVSGTKTWKDNNNQDGIRPETITVSLLADGEKVDEVKVTEKSDWKYEFKDLPVNKAGKEIKYSVTENKVDGYETTIDGFNITNTHTPKEVPTSGGKSTNNKSNNNKSGYLPKTGEAETTALVNLGVTMIVIFLMSHIWLSQRRKSKED
ncbi:Cna B-type domain-containing protein [Vagococcus fluvialis]|uniref:Cna B-type domain-containing protein n=1 Tax=Vagococcus fluvialis TaxID=2738 RepID=UPI001D0BDAAC|nr:Cna B-type domain-containing protein [Vagococcus fluvialis]UDM80818.1 Cna B-type domain-containing protein [Vagococcus fluvialis]